MTDPKLCGDFGGTTAAGKPCRRRAVEGGMCAIHTGAADVGRPVEFDPTDEEVEQIEKLAAVLTQEQTADFLGVPRTTFQDAIERDERISGAYTRGKAKAIANMGSSVFRAGVNGDVSAAKFYLATQAGWSEKQQHEVKHSGGIAVGEERKALSDATPAELAAMYHALTQTNGRAAAA